MIALLTLALVTLSAQNPTAALNAPVQDLSFNDIPLEEAVKKISTQTGVPIKFRGSTMLRQRVTYSSGSSAIPLQLALERLIYRTPDLWYGWDRTGIVIFMDPTVNPQFLTEINRLRDQVDQQNRVAYLKMEDGGVRIISPRKKNVPEAQQGDKATTMKWVAESNTKFDSGWEVVERFLKAHGKKFQLATLPDAKQGRPAGGLRWLPDSKLGFHRALRQMLIRLNPPMTWEVANNEYRIRPLNSDEFLALKSNFSDVATLDVMVAGETGEERAKVWAPDRRSFFTLSSTRLSRFSADGKKELATSPMLQGYHLAVSPNSEFVAVGRNQRLQVFRARDLAAIGSVETRTNGAPRAVFSEDGRIVAWWDGTTVAAGPVSDLMKGQLPYDFRGDRTRELRSIDRLAIFTTAEGHRFYVEGNGESQIRRITDFVKIGAAMRPETGIVAKMGPTGSEVVKLLEGNLLVWRRISFDKGPLECGPFKLDMQAFIQRPVINGDTLVASYRKAAGKAVTVRRLTWRWGEKEPALDTKEFKSTDAVGIAAFGRIELADEATRFPTTDRKPVPRTFVLGANPDIVFLDLPGELGVFNLRTGSSVNPYTVLQFPEGRSGTAIQRRRLQMTGSSDREFEISVEELSGKTWTPKTYRVSLDKFRATPGRIEITPPPMTIEKSREAITVMIQGRQTAQIDPSKYYKFDPQTSDVPDAVATADGQTIYLNFRGETVEIFFEDDQEKAVRFKGFSGTQLQISPSGRYLLGYSLDGRGAADKVDIFDLHKREAIYSGPGQLAQFVQRPTADDIAQGRDIDWMYIPSDGMLRVIAPKFEYVGVAPTNDRVNRLQLNSSKTHLIGLTDSGQLVVWHGLSGRWLASHIALNGGRFVTYTPDSYYMASRGTANILYFRRGAQLYPFDQFDIRLNRPDIVTGRLLSQDLDAQKLNFEAYLRRVRKTTPDIFEAWRIVQDAKEDKMNFKPERELFPFGSIGLFTLAQVDVLNEADIPRRTDARELELKFRITDEQAKLENYNVYVNGVPLLGIDGVNLVSENTGQVEKSIKVPLTPGQNRIRIIATNRVAGETRSEPIEVQCTAAAKPSLYLVLVGANRYADPALAALSADNDVASLKTMFLAQKGKEFADVKVFERTGAQVTTSIVNEAIQFVSTAQPQDRVIVFYGGHGIVVMRPDKKTGVGEPNYLLATHGTRIGSDDEIFNSSIPFDSFQEIVDRTPAREKLLLLDSCHSGEVDDELGGGFERIDGQLPQAASTGLARSTPETVMIPTSRASTLMKDQFVDLRRRSGAVIIAASAANEVAADTGKNGMFTAVFLQGLSGEADGYAGGASDGVVRISELLPFVADTVQWRTQNRQRPLARQENFENDFVLSQRKGP
jgi:hypothetical protein